MIFLLYFVLWNLFCIRFQKCLLIAKPKGLGWIWFGFNFLNGIWKSLLVLCNGIHAWFSSPPCYQFFPQPFRTHTFCLGNKLSVPPSPPWCSVASVSLLQLLRLQLRALGLGLVCPAPQMPLSLPISALPLTFCNLVRTATVFYVIWYFSIATSTLTPKLSTHIIAFSPTIFNRFHSKFRPLLVGSNSD